MSSENYDTTLNNQIPPGVGDFPKLEHLKNPMPDPNPQVKRDPLFGAFPSGWNRNYGNGEREPVPTKGPHVDIKLLGMTAEELRLTEEYPKGDITIKKTKKSKIKTSTIDFQLFKQQQRGWKDTKDVIEDNGYKYTDIKKIDTIKTKKVYNIDAVEANKEMVRFAWGYEEIPKTKPRGHDALIQREPNSVIKQYARSGASLSGYYAGFRGEDPKFNLGVIPPEHLM